MWNAWQPHRSATPDRAKPEVHFSDAPVLLGRQIGDRIDDLHAKISHTQIPNDQTVQQRSSPTLMSYPTATTQLSIYPRKPDVCNLVEERDQGYHDGPLRVLR